MYLFTRTAQLTGPLREAFGWAAEITAFVNGHGASHVSLWSATYGQPVGTVTWTTWVDSMADISTLFVALESHDDYHEVLARGRDFLAAPAQDEIRQLVHGVPPETPPPAGAVVVRTTAMVANGQYVAALGWGADMAGHVGKVSGQPSFFLMDSFGGFGQVTWFSVSPDVAAAEAANDAINSDADYLARLSDVATLFLPGSGHRAMATKLV